MRRAPHMLLLAGTLLRIAGLAAYTLVFAEIFVRLVAPQPLMPRYVTGAPWGVRTNVADAVYRHTTPEVSVEYRINRQGMRDDRVFPVAKPSGTCRVALLGDSYGMGYELELGDSVARQIEKRLEGRHTVELLNFSVSGFGTAENLRTYQAYARRFAPDVVLVQWQVTDYDDNLRSGLWRLRKGHLIQGNPTFLPGVATQDWLMSFATYRFIADHSHVYNFAREQVGWRIKQLTAFLAKRETGPSKNEVEQNTYVINQAQVDLAAALLRYTGEAVNKDGAKMFVLDIPNRMPERVFSSSYDLMPADLKNNIPVISALAAFRSAARDPEMQLFFKKGARHLTPLGSRLLAEEAARLIESSGALTGCPR